MAAPDSTPELDAGVESCGSCTRSGSALDREAILSGFRVALSELFS